MPASLKALREAVEFFHRKWTARGGQLTYWTCEVCHRRNPTRQPTLEDVGPKGCWDTMTQCTECGALNFVQTYADGTTVVYRGPRVTEAQP